ncbi:hypothetical protein NDU88_002878 [Pleurodeles waltl]|uniref:Uncharacterized protein n=1 Tax=Pleurodeles waltl TaxID=8319 RepID=A0AAV7MQ65_PLEWA|nr:hypothetical protein NDU88_002878 [Pleurodeles waltl]
MGYALLTLTQVQTGWLLPAEAHTPSPSRHIGLQQRRAGRAHQRLEGWEQHSWGVCGRSPQIALKIGRGPRSHISCTSTHRGSNGATTGANAAPPQVSTLASPDPLAAAATPQHPQASGPWYPPADPCRSGPTGGAACWVASAIILRSASS